LLCLQLTISAADPRYRNDRRQTSQSSGTDIGEYIAQGLGLVGAEKLGSEKATSVASSTPQSTRVPAHGYNSSSPVVSTQSVSSHLSGSNTSAVVFPTVSANGSINSYALSCYSARYTWRTFYDEWTSTALNGKTFSKSVFLTTTQHKTIATLTVYPTNASAPYTLCDGSPRVDAKPATITSTYNWTSTTMTTMLHQPTFTLPAPCSMSPEDCMYLYYNTPLGPDDDVLLGACGLPAHLYQPCLIGGGPVRLAYFPVSTINGDLCKGGGTTITSMAGPTTIEVMGTTLTSGSVYLSFQSLYAYQEGFGIRIGPNFTDYLMPLPSSAISTQCGGWFSAQGPGTAVNWADFNYPQPASAYACENRCTTELSYMFVNGTGQRYTPPPECYTIWDDFNPVLAVPTEARKMVPEWSTCSFWDDVLPNFLFDPPLALHPADAIAKATISPSSTQSTTLASPALTVTSTIATSTPHATANPKEILTSTPSGNIAQPTQPHFDTQSAPSDLPGSTSVDVVHSSDQLSSEAQAAPPASFAPTVDTSMSHPEHTSEMRSETPTLAALASAISALASAFSGTTLETQAIVSEYQASATLATAAGAELSGSVTKSAAEEAPHSLNDGPGSSGFLQPTGSPVEHLIFTAGSQTFTASAAMGETAQKAVVVVNGATVSAGGSAQAVQGHTMSLALDNGLVVDGSSTVRVDSTMPGETTSLLLVPISSDNGRASTMEFGNPTVVPESSDGSASTTTAVTTNGASAGSEAVQTTTTAVSTSMDDNNLGSSPVSATAAIDGSTAGGSSETTDVTGSMRSESSNTAHTTLAAVSEPSRSSPTGSPAPSTTATTATTTTTGAGIRWTTKPWSWVLSSAMVFIAFL